MEYKAAHGDCNVPNVWAEDQQLANWVHNQRNNLRKTSTLDPAVTEARWAKLDAIGFSWSRPAKRRAAVYALNYLMKQQEWGAWLEFQKEQGLEGTGRSRPSSKRSRPSSKSKRAGSAARSRPASAAEAATAAATSGLPDAVGA